MPFEGDPAGGTTISVNGYVLSVSADPLHQEGCSDFLEDHRPHGPVHHRFFPILHFSYLKEPQKGGDLEHSQGPGWGFTVVRWLGCLMTIQLVLVLLTICVA